MNKKNNFFEIKRLNKKIYYTCKEIKKNCAKGNRDTVEVAVVDKRDHFSFIENQQKVWLCPTLGYWSFEDYLKQWQAAFAYLEINEESCLIEDICVDEHNEIEAITLNQLFILDTMIVVKEIFLEKDFLQQYIFKNEKIKIDFDDWKLFISEKSLLQSVLDISYTIPLDNYKKNIKKTKDCDAFIKKEKNMKFVKNKYIPNITIGIFDSKKNSSCHMFDTFLFLDNLIIKMWSKANSWNIKKYIQQWEYGLERLRFSDSSCFVINIAAYEPGDILHVMRMICLYKKDDKIILNSYAMYDDKELNIKYGLMEKDQIFDTAYFNKNIRFLDKVKQEDFFTLIPPLKIKKNDLYLKINNEIKKSQKKTVINNEKYFKRIYFIMSSKAGYKLEELYINEEISKKKFINKEN